MTDATCVSCAQEQVPDQPANDRGPRVVSRLGHDEPARVPALEMDRGAAAVRAAINR